MLEHEIKFQAERRRNGAPILSFDFYLSECDRTNLVADSIKRNGKIVIELNNYMDVDSVIDNLHYTAINELNLQIEEYINESDSRCNKE